MNKTCGNCSFDYNGHCTINHFDRHSANQKGCNAYVKKESKKELKKMKAREMINILEDYINEHGEDVELNLRNWQNGANSKIVEV